MCQAFCPCTGTFERNQLRDQAYTLLKSAIADTDIYDAKQELRLDEPQLTAALGVSGTPVREVLSVLEQEGFIRTILRRGYLHRPQIKTRNNRDDLGVGCAQVHGGAPRHVDCNRRGDRLIHVRAIRRATITQSDRAARSIIDHLKIIEALEKRDTELAERLTRQHTLDLAVHVDRYSDFLVQPPGAPARNTQPPFTQRWCDQASMR
jgi:DNA-binding GntR family transcriptional regulator